jgi:hypothetical protein
MILPKTLCSASPLVDLGKMHDTFCKDGDDVCGSSRTHRRSLEEMITQVIEPHTIHKAAETNQKKKTLRFKNLTPADVNASPTDKGGKTRKATRNVNAKGSHAAEQRTGKPNRSVKTTVSLVGSSIPANNSEIDATDSNVIQNISELQEGTKKPRNRIIHARTKEIVRSEMVIQPENEVRVSRRIPDVFSRHY